MAAALTGGGPAAFSAAGLGEPSPLPVNVGCDVPREGSAEAVYRAQVSRRIREGLRRLRAEHQQLIVLFIDLGRPPGGDGDDLLGEVVARLAGATRATDTVIPLAAGRIVLVAEGVSSGVPPFVDVLRDRCGRVFARPVHRGGKGCTVHPRIGAAVAAAGAVVTAQRLLAEAEAAMCADEASVWARP